MKGEIIMSIKKGTPPPRYDEAFKTGAVKMVTEQRLSMRSAAADLGVCIDTLRSWVRASGAEPSSVERQNRSNRRQRELEAENRALRKQIAQKDEVISVLIP